jgi:ATP-dependent DNA helicase RecQ
MFCLSRDQLYRLSQVSPTEDLVITALLRNYGGLFVDYGFIDEAFIAHETGLTKPMVYQTLKGLAEKHIIRFIPQKNTPLIRYLQRREDSEHIMLTPAVYDDLKKRYTERIQAIISYVQTDDECRSRQLLRYFGEKNDNDCGQCDVCLSYSHTLTNKQKREEAQQHILSILADGQPHHVTQLRSIPLPYEQIDAALEYLMLEEDIYMEDGYLTIAR